ncbi:MAG: OmpA family protein [Bacteroidetes bacterium]|nr:OmpA family protein [Bacteroidota bacterium]
MKCNKTCLWRPMLSIVNSLIFLFVVMVCPGTIISTQAQIWNRLKDAAQQTAEDHITNDVEDATDRAIDNAEHPKIHKREKGDNQSESSNEPTRAPKSQAVASATDATTTLKPYQNYDFVPGDDVLFADDFTEDQDGEFPAHWNLKSGQAVVNQVAGKPTFCLTEGNYCRVYPRMKTTSYLTDPFTIEFDTYSDGNGNESPILFLIYTDKDGNSQDGEIAFNRGDDEGRGDVSLSNFGNDGLSSSLPEQLIAHYTNNWHHCAIIYKNGQLKCYVDQYRILVQPNLGCVPTSFYLGGLSGGDGHPIMITNVRVAKGGSMNMIGRKFTETKIVTHGITFDIDKSNIKPQSMGTLNMIVKVLRNNPDLKFEIDGHTDNSGQSTHNLTLSQQRAASVKKQLVSMGIDASRLTTKGFGDTKPIADNNTPEGRANNRRVEFVRQ